MDRTADMTRDTLEVVIGRRLDAETRTTPPPPGEEGDWLLGSAGFTEPNEHGWMAPVPPSDVWVPRALVFWRLAVLSDAPASDEQMR